MFDDFERLIYALTQVGAVEPRLGRPFGLRRPFVAVQSYYAADSTHGVWS
jgi:hypothetical protein